MMLTVAVVSEARHACTRNLTFKEADFTPVMLQAPLWVSLRSEQLPGGAVGG